MLAELLRIVNDLLSYFLAAPSIFEKHPLLASGRLQCQVSGAIRPAGGHAAQQLQILLV